MGGSLFWLIIASSGHVDPRARLSIVESIEETTVAKGSAREERIPKDLQILHLVGKSQRRTKRRKKSTEEEAENAALRNCKIDFQHIIMVNC